ncbi:MAG TPA: succinate dehydrogenase assembly factor 2 [Burkholderiales bacterium]|nr:succinate dehydrogenase assembly factor 2 [Burkholderiales bacterium]
MDAALDSVSRNRLHWKCRRGLLELDLVLARFIPILKDEDVQPLHALLDLPDNDLWDIIAGRSDEYDRRFEETVARLRAVTLAPLYRAA